MVRLQAFISGSCDDHTDVVITAPDVLRRGLFYVWGLLVELSLLKASMRLPSEGRLSPSLQCVAATALSGVTHCPDAAV